LGTDEGSIMNWEKGRTVPKVYRLPAIIRFLGYNPLPEPRHPAHPRAPGVVGARRGRNAVHSSIASRPPYASLPPTYHPAPDIA
jgi:hypothetical protein